MKKTDWYNEESIASVIKKVNENQIFLPALQRKFVWKTKQIEQLFDSIMQGFPIGTFLFWELNDRKAISDFVFYKFIEEYKENESRNKEAILTGRDNIITVLDGQQRLTSMYIALRGSYRYKIPRKHKSNPNAYPKRYLYLNLLPVQSVNSKFEFRFLTEDAAEKFDETHIWYKVNKVLDWKKVELNEQYKALQENNDPKLITKNRVVIKETLGNLHGRICKEEYIAHFDLKNKAIDEVLDIFIRVNNGGTTLSKTELLMSTITASWVKSRDKVENLLENINGRGFNFDIDFIMRTSLVLLDKAVLFRVGSFQTDTIINIKKKWNEICHAIIKSVDLLVDFGFDGLTLTSRNSVIPIIYYIYKGGRSKDQERAELKKYLQHVLLMGFFGSHGDQALTNIRDLLRKKTSQGEYKLIMKSFSFDELKNSLNMKGKTLEITEQDIDIFLTYKKGRQAFLVLSMLYSNLRYNEIEFDQDHIHPAVMFRDRKLAELNLNEEKIEQWKIIKDQIPNLQMMEERRNKVKNRTPFNEWLERITDPAEKEVYLKTNYIPKNISYEHENFEEFFNKRKEILKKELINILS
jgi:uncharacterized protein with ParB-like and HNH nuclease domain